MHQKYPQKKLLQRKPQLRKILKAKKFKPDAQRRLFSIGAHQPLARL
jgi:hypothetical protein